MALIRCPECGIEVSSKAPACPKCGFPVAEHILKFAASNPEQIHQAGHQAEPPVAAIAEPGDPRSTPVTESHHRRGWIAVGVVLIVAVVIAVGVAKNKKTSSSTTSGAYEAPRELSGVERISRCKEWAPRACNALLGCVPGFDPRNLPPHIQPATSRFSEIRSKAQEACIAQWKERECNDFDDSWDAEEWKLKSCFDTAPYECECAEPNTAFCYPKKISSGNDSDPGCPNTAPDTASQYMDLLVTLDEALAFAWPYRMGNTEIANGLVAGWLGHATWSDFSAEANASNLTTLDEVKKDPDGEYGKRLCGRGHTVQISKEYESRWEAIIAIDNDVVHLDAVGSSKGIIESTVAKFCGVALGTYNYKNVGGGTTISVKVVGMFDLPENRMKPPDKNEAQTR